MYAHQNNRSYLKTSISFLEPISKRERDGQKKERRTDRQRERKETDRETMRETETTQTDRENLLNENERIKGERSCSRILRFMSV